MATRAAVDIGGTFTDLVYLDEETGEVGVAKSSTTPGRFEDGVMETLSQAELDGVGFLAHGTTVIINALTERKGARTALVTTRGFRDVLEIQKANRPDLYNLLYEKPRPFVPRRLRLEVRERVTHKGEVLVPLHEDDVRRAVAEARRQGAEAVAISFLNAYANPDHERRAAEIVRQEWPEVAVSVSHELTKEWREYDRTSTAVLDAYVKPVASRYLDRLARRLEERGIRPSARYCMQSNGGISRFDVAARSPINLIESGPVGGVIGAAALGSLIGERNLITLDIGGTTAKASLVERGAVRLTGDYHIERMKHMLFKLPERRDEQNLYFNKAESRMGKEWMDPTVSEPLAILLGGGVQNIEEGRRKLNDLRKLQIDNYLADLQKATFVRRHLNGRLEQAAQA